MAPSRLLAVASLASGVAALIYQVLWSRQLSLVVGTSTEAVAVVLSSFMAGLGVGNALAARVIVRWSRAGRPDVRRLARTYAGLEVGIAGAALVLPFALPGAIALLAPLYEGPSASPLGFRLARIGVAAAFLMLPTTAMGATLPVLVELARPGAARAGAVAGGLYAFNTVGAVGGALLAPLVLLPWLGLSRAIIVAAAANGCAALLALVAAARARTTQAEPATSRRPPEAEPIVPAPNDAPTRRAARTALAVSFLSGFGALAHEVAWTRALALLVGPTVYAFAFVVAAVVAGLALGSAVAGRLADRLRRPGLALAAVQVGVVASALVLVPLIGWLPVPTGEMVRALAEQPERLIAMEGLLILLALVLPATLFGASFPIAVRMVADAGGPAGSAVGRVLAWNTLGAVMSPLLVSFAVLPTLGLRAAVVGAAAVHALAAAALLLSSAGDPKTRGRPAVAAALAACIIALRLLPPWDLELLSGGAYRYAPREEPGDLEESLRAGELLYYADGALATVTVKQLGATRTLVVDGKVEASNTGDMGTQRLLAHVPLLLRGEARHAAIVGLGSGATSAAALRHPLASLDVLEISPEVVAAARAHFGDVHEGAFDDPRFRLHVTDARNHLLLTSRRYDVIISEPSNPWMAGVASLFTRDFFALVRSRLGPGGIFCQWMHIYGMPVEDVRTVVGGFADVFPQSALFQVSEGDLLLLGAEADWPRPTPEALSARLSPAVADDLRRVGVTRPAVLATLFVLGPGRLAVFAQGAPRHTDDRPILELRAARGMLARTTRPNREALLQAQDPAPVEPWTALVRELTAEDYADRGRMLERTTGIALALEAYGFALRLDPRFIPAQEGLVRIGRVGDAVRVAESLLRQLADGPDPVGARVSLAELYHSHGRIADAGRELEAVLALDARHVRALKTAAAIQGELGQAGAVEVLAGRAATLAPADAEASALLASASLLADEPAVAADRAERALSLDPRNWRALRVRAIALAQSGRYDEASGAFDALLEVDGDSYETWVHAGAFRADRADWTGALQAFERATDLAPDSRTAWEGLARAAAMLSDRRRSARAEAALGRIESSGGGRR